jgi:DNA mismatch repair ATPase MutS
MKMTHIISKSNSNRVTPGTLTEEKFLEARKSNYLAALAVDSLNTIAILSNHHNNNNNNNSNILDVPLSLAWLELSTGEFQMSPSSRTSTFFRIHIVIQKTEKVLMFYEWKRFGSVKTLSTDLARISPSELLVPKELETHPAFTPILKVLLSLIFFSECCFFLSFSTLSFSPIKQYIKC